MSTMGDELIANVAADQFNRFSRAQAYQSGLTDKSISHRLATGRWVLVEHGVFAIAPVLEHDRCGLWMTATLTHEGSWLSRLSSSVAYEVLSFEGPHVTVTRPGSGGPQLHGHVLVHRSQMLEGDVTTFKGIPITTPARTLADIAPIVSDRALRRAVREAVRLRHITLPELGDALGRYRGRRGIRKLAATVARYAGLPIERARSGTEVRAMEILRAAGGTMPRLNVVVAGEEADLSWPAHRLIVEIDGDPFHLDKGEDARKEKAWREAAWTVKRIPADDVDHRPHRLLALSPPNVA